MIRRQNGFTLIEILIAVTILSFMAVFAAQAIQRSIKFKAKMEQEMDDYSVVRNALQVITGDINKAFHWYDLSEELRKQINAEAQSQNKPQPFATPNQNNPVIPAEKLTSFVGEKDSLYLTSLAHTRTFKDAPESDQAEIGYFLKSVKNIKTKESSQALIRRESLVLDEDVTRGGTETVLLENVKSLTFRYLGGLFEKKEWFQTWRTTDSGDAKAFNRFPEAVEIILVTKKNEKEISLSTIAALNMPNNDPFKKPSPTPGFGANPGGTPP